MKGMKTGVLILMLYFSAVFSTASQVTFDPDPEGDVQLQVTPLTPPVQVTTVQCYSSSPEFKVQYVTADSFEEIFNTSIGDQEVTEGSPVVDITCHQHESKYRIILSTLRFIADPELVGGKFRLKATLDNNRVNSTLSRRTYTFPAPFNLTGSVNATLNSTFIWTCRTTSEFPTIEWFRGKTRLAQIGLFPNRSCGIYDQNDSYIYNCQESALTYTLTIPGSRVTEDLQASRWRCRHVSSEVNGSKFMLLDILVPVMTVTIIPGIGSTTHADENQMITFNCITNNANPPPAILWFIGSSDVTTQAGTNRYTLTLNVTREYNRKLVMCSAWNNVNTANQSDSTTLDVTFPPTNNEELQIVGYTSGQVLYENNPAMVNISCTQPGGNPVANMTFTCRSRTGTHGNTATEAIRRLSLQNDRSLNGQQCVCVSSHINGYMRSKNVSFVVHYPPSTPRVNKSSPFPWKAPGVYNLTCDTIPGNPLATTYIWKEGEYMLPITSHTYEFNPLRSTDNGRQLYCQVINNYTLHENVVLTSSLIILQVEFDPAVTLEQSSAEVIEWHSAVLRCSATGNPAPSVAWYRGSTPVTQSSIFSSNYSIVNIYRTSAGNYTCKAKSSSPGGNVLQPDQKTLHLRVLYPPTVSLHLQNTTETTADHVIRCTAVGDPDNSTVVGLEQRIGSTLIRNITNFRESSPGNITFKIDRVTYQDMGTYTCLASNGIPDRRDRMVQTGSAYFNVFTPAKFQTEYFSEIISLQRAVSVGIPFYCNPPVTMVGVEWINKTGSGDRQVVSSQIVSLSIADDNVEMIMRNRNVTLRGQIAFMNITSVQNYHTGDYVLRIRNSESFVASLDIRLNLPDVETKPQFQDQKVASVAGGMAGGFLVIIIILIVVIVMREKRYRANLVRKKDKGQKEKGRKASCEKYEDVQSTNTAIEQGKKQPNSEDQMSTYEELQIYRDMHTYEDIGSSAQYVNLQLN